MIRRLRFYMVEITGDDLNLFGLGLDNINFCNPLISPGLILKPNTYESFHFLSQQILEMCL